VPKIEGELNSPSCTRVEAAPAWRADLSQVDDGKLRWYAADFSLHAWQIDRWPYQHARWMEARARATDKESDRNEKRNFEFTTSASKPQDFCDQNSQKLQDIEAKSQEKIFSKAIKYSDTQSALDSLNFHAAFLDIDDLPDSSIFSSEALMSSCNSLPAQQTASVFGRNPLLSESRTTSLCMWRESPSRDEMPRSLEEMLLMLGCMDTQRLSAEQLQMGYTDCDLSYLVC